MGVYSPILCCEGNIRSCTSWVCIHLYSVVKATSVAVRRGCAFTHTFMKAIEYSLQLCAVKPGTMSMCKYCNRVNVCVWRLWKTFSCRQSQRERKKKRRRNGYGRQMPLRIQPPSFSCSCSLCRLHIHAHRLACTHLLSNGMGQWLCARAYRHLQLVTHWKAVKTPFRPHTHHRQKVARLWLWSGHSPARLMYTATGALFIYFSLFVGGGGCPVTSSYQVFHL